MSTTYQDILETLDGAEERRIRSGAGVRQASVVFRDNPESRTATVSIRGNVVCIAHEDGLVELDSCGWHTVTTSNAWRGAGLPVYSLRKQYMLSDPYPGRVELPFVVEDHGAFLSEKLRVKPVWCLREGDMVDLEDDPYADPKKDDLALEFEYAVVLSVNVETEECILVEFTGTAVGFPPGHYVRVAS